jgi:hypothetical protein
MAIDTRPVCSVLVVWLAMPCCPSRLDCFASRLASQLWKRIRRAMAAGALRIQIEFMKSLQAVSGGLPPCLCARIREHQIWHAKAHSARQQAPARLTSLSCISSQLTNVFDCIAAFNCSGAAKRRKLLQGATSCCPLMRGRLDAWT